MRTTRKVAVALVASAAATAFSAGTAGAAAKPAPKATGSVVLSNPLQYASFDAFQSVPAKGSISYTNWESVQPGSGVWAPESFVMQFVTDGGSGTYTQSVSSWTPTSLTGGTFSGSGDCGCGWLSTFSGTVSGSAFNLTMTETNASDSTDTAALLATGTIASDGTVSGTWSDDYQGGRTGTFSIADIGHEVLSYTAAVTCAKVSGNTATFGFNAPFLNVPVVVNVTDGGSPGAGNDTWAHGVDSGTGQCSAANATHTYPITAGNLTVFS